ncbi:MAG: Mur ligase family protein, partial [Actinomycetota bacterium]|nr:Mur ligase family protein [Actinomycetota bacterium]
MNEFTGKRVLVIGLGSSGFSAARALLDLDAKVRVTEVMDSPLTRERAAALMALGAEVELGGHDLALLDGDVAVLSPGIPPSSEVVQQLLRSGIETFSEIELAFRLARCDFLAITGTNGKTTTTSILAAILERAGIATAAAGNIGWPLIDAITAVPESGAIAVEVSSFQLAGIKRFRPKVAVLLNVAEDHTDWHGSSAEYARAKERIVENQQSSDTFLPNADDPVAMSVAAAARSRTVPFSARHLVPDGIGIENSKIVWRDRDI